MGPAQNLFQTISLSDGVLQEGHYMDQDAFQNTEQLWSVLLEFTPQETELLLTDTQRTTVKVPVD